MRVQVLISTMNQPSVEPLLKAMNIHGEYVIVNQVPALEQKPQNSNSKNRIFLSFKEKGLSKSRNRAIRASNADICMIADDDMCYVDNFNEIVAGAFRRYRDADIIAFRVDGEKGPIKHPLKAGRVKFLHTMKLCSVQLALRVTSIKQNGLQFSEDFGTGTVNFMGEENIFLADCIKKGLKVYSYPVKIANINEGDSTWFNGYNADYFYVKGKVFYKISRFLALPLVLQFAIRKRKLYGAEIGIWQALSHMLKGVYAQARD